VVVLRKFGRGTQRKAGTNVPKLGYPRPPKTPHDHERVDNVSLDQGSANVGF